MTLARLLAAALVVCSLPALAQDQRPLTQEELFRGGRFFFVRPDPAATPAEPWRVFSDWTADLRSGQNALDPRRLDHIKLDRIKSDPQVRRFKFDPRPETLVVDSNGPTCYAIRSYVVARDSKDSDSTHPAGYSTCQPAARYRVKTTEMQSVTQYR
jgi:hypothetical protein